MTEPTLQEQSDNQDEQAAAATDPDRLEIPQKFQNPDGTLNQHSLLKSYQEIESSKSTAEDSSPPTTDSDESPDESTTEDSSDKEVSTEDLTVTPDKNSQFDPFFQEFERDGKLSDESFTALEELGVSRQLAEGYIGSNVQLAERQTEDLIAAVGGKEQYSQMQAWAAGNQTPEANIAFNKAVQGFDPEARVDAVEGLYEAWSTANGIAPASTPAAADQAYSGPKAYASEQEFYADMKTAKYKSDPAYRLAAHQRANRMYGLTSNTKLT